MESKEMTEFVEALREAKLALVDLRAQMLTTNHTISKVLNDSNLRGTLTMLSDDIVIRRNLNEMV